MTTFSQHNGDEVSLHDIGITQASPDESNSYADGEEPGKAVTNGLRHAGAQPVGSELARAVALQDSLGGPLSCGGFIKTMFQCFSPMFAKKRGLSVELDSLQGPPKEGYLLPPIALDDRGKKTLVLDLDESLVHSSFQPTADPDFVLPFQVGDHIYTMYVGKRPGVDEFLKRMGALYEIVVFTASLSKYANPLLDLLDTGKVVRMRLFRDSCISIRGCYVKDLSKMGRPLKSIILVDNSPASYVLQPGNAIAVTSWFGSTTDRELFDLIPYLEEVATVDDVCSFLAKKKPKFTTSS